MIWWLIRKLMIRGRLDMLKAVRAELNKPVAALLDTKGPEIRLKEFKNGVEMLEAARNSPSSRIASKCWAITPQS